MLKYLYFQLPTFFFNFLSWNRSLDRPSILLIKSSHSRITYTLREIVPKTHSRNRNSDEHIRNSSRTQATQCQSLIRERNTVPHIIRGLLSEKHFKTSADAACGYLYLTITVTLNYLIINTDYALLIFSFSSKY